MDDLKKKLSQVMNSQKSNVKSAGYSDESTFTRKKRKLNRGPAPMAAQAIKTSFAAHFASGTVTVNQVNYKQ